MKHIKLFEQFMAEESKLSSPDNFLNESFWVNLEPGYKEGDKNGHSWLNVAGVPGGYTNIDQFIDPLQSDLEQNGYIITNKIISLAKKRFEAIGDNLSKLNRDLKKGDDFWIKSLHYAMGADREYKYPGAAYLIWWLLKHVNKKITRFSY